MNEEEMIDALKKGATARVSHSGEVAVQAHNDLSPECFRAREDHDNAHFWQCPDCDHAHFWQCPECLESEAEATRMDAASHRTDGNEPIALELKAEAQKLRSRARRFAAARLVCPDSE